MGLGLVWAIESVRLGVFALVVHELLVLLGRKHGELFARCEGGDRRSVACGFEVDIRQYSFCRQIVVVTQLGEEKLATKLPADAVCYCINKLCIDC